MFDPPSLPRLPIGLMGTAKPPSLHPSASGSALPGICKDLIGSALARLRGSLGGEESAADRLVWDLLSVRSAVAFVSAAYEGLDDDGQENRKPPRRSL